MGSWPVPIGKLQEWRQGRDTSRARALGQVWERRLSDGFSGTSPSGEPQTEPTPELSPLQGGCPGVRAVLTC